MSSGLHFVAADTQEAFTAQRALTQKYGQVPAKEARAIVVLGGDGFMLESIHQHGDLRVPFFGINHGSVGFLLNIAGRPGDLVERIEKGLMVSLKPLTMTAEKLDGSKVTAFAYNEVSVFRATRQAAKLKISVDGEERLDQLIAEGALVSTPAGSTAYNFSAHGPIIPIEANLLALTPISPFRPRRWRGALLPAYATIRFDVLEVAKRPVHAVADFTETSDVKSITIKQSEDRTATLIFDPDHSLHTRIIEEQFAG